MAETSASKPNVAKPKAEAKSKAEAKTAAKPVKPVSAVSKKAAAPVEVTAPESKAKTAAVPKPESAAKPEKKPSGKKASDKAPKIGAEERYRMVEVAAYFIAERDKFKGSPVDYWVAAENQINKILGKR
ncbi:DUF2934 domain-containing protein [Pseudomethylobacillus aquaticus]|uniref:DUF2934 domain-containing protein n=1 Tax=Pseudomethylobacillus aquaticus TaxID=2676064 RepID=A0A3N0V755_9PROT|nr:DUF2934 domain-containing protein [Pseudomethylobacillus aquaticus]ROH88218.1 DUF2934 domain-containing protein [Pseudomethylobacillus aquaticus]